MKKGIIVTAITLFLSGTGARAQVVSAVHPFRPHQTAVAPSVSHEPFVAAQGPVVQPVVVRRTYVRRQNYVRRPRVIVKGDRSSTQPRSLVEVRQAARRSARWRAAARARRS